MRILPICLFLFEIREHYSQLIANDVVSDYAQVKELLSQYYRRQARKSGSDYDPESVRSEAIRKWRNDGTEASINRHIWAEVFENDIILTLPQAEALLKETAGIRTKRQAHPSPNSFWPSLTISYEFAQQEGSFQNIIRSALRHIEQNTCIRFKENGGGRDGLRYFRGSGCWSNVGRTGGRQLISIGYGCDSLGIVAHETLHALGLWHEQSRDDRNQFIRIQPARIIRGTEGNFERRTPKTSDNMGQPYDLGSVMHYGSKAFTSDWNYNTIESVDKRFQTTLGQRAGISFKDAKMINLRYCAGICSNKLPCANDGYTDPNDCQRCRCPPGYGGLYCNEIEQSSCGKELWATPRMQTLNSGPVYANSNCVWQIRSAGRRIQLTITSASFPCLDACTSFVEVKATKTKTATGARICCNATHTFTSEGNDITLIFRGEPLLQVGYLGFSAQYRLYGEVMNTEQPSSHPTTKPTTTPFTVATRLPMSSWGVWGEWSSCSHSCGGCGRRKRVRGCYGGNLECVGEANDVQECNMQACPVQPTDQNCKGRVLLPCYLLENIVFGELPKKTARFNPDYRSRRTREAMTFASESGTKSKRSPEWSPVNQICEKRFTYKCPTSLLTIHMSWKTDTASYASADAPEISSCCPGYYNRGGNCYQN